MENSKGVYFIVDVAKCVGCFNCMVACKDEHVGNSWLPYTDGQQKHDQKWIEPVRHERGSVPFTEICFVTQLCQHCGDAPCEKAAPDAVKRRPDGIVLLDPEKARGNRELADACPFGRISWNEERETAQKCTMCAHLLDGGWMEPRCVQACPLRALSVARDSEVEGMQGLEQFCDGSHAPRVLYRNLYKRDTCFIAGALAYRDGDIERAAEGAVVRLLWDDRGIASVTTDFFGEFKIDRLPKNAGELELVCALDGYKPITRAVKLGEDSICLDVIVFEKK